MGKKGGGSGWFSSVKKFFKQSPNKDPPEKKRKRELMEKPPSDDVCPICFRDFDVPCRAPCGHWYCGSCILQYWNFNAALRPCKCPMCSQLITKLTPEASFYYRNEGEISKVPNGSVRDKMGCNSG